ncbi:hypothetical protein GCM10016455_18780 [Aliiroseovarius zhejiangensis]|uniref:Uncharacterized protein n=1 Tax=Aliiroseovarius zhejiangensis TaxID=1632025 RepID=A0ABQ3IY84_9RHOB|nr:hypothetical protein GCM10016455_18780 [Aliiroseovarius zhejiangensis]
MRKGKLIDLSLDRLDDIPVRMTKAGHSRAARSIQVFISIRINDIYAISFYRDGRDGFGVTGEDV